MKELKAMKTVYCYMFPESYISLKSIEERINRNYFLRTTKAIYLSNLFKDLFKPSFEFPSISSGSLKDSVNLDELFIPVSKRIVYKYKKIIIGLENFENIYPSAGSSDAIFKTLAYLKTNGCEMINVFKTEYEGFGISARALGLEVVEHDIKIFNPNIKTKGVWYISNPSAMDGNILDKKLLKTMLDSGNKIIFDFAYVGTTEKTLFDVSHKNVMGVLFSLSKPYGVFEERITGFAFLRDEYFKKENIDQFLYGNRWFTDKVRTLQSLKLVEDLGPRSNGNFPMFKKYKKIQKEIISYLNNEYNIPFKESDSFLLAYIKKEDLIGISEEKLNIIKDFKRGDNYRFCLTPYFEMWKK